MHNRIKSTVLTAFPLIFDLDLRSLLTREMPPAIIIISSMHPQHNNYRCPFCDLIVQRQVKLNTNLQERPCCIVASFSSYKSFNETSQSCTASSQSSLFSFSRSSPLSLRLEDAANKPLPPPGPDSTATAC